VREEGGGKGGGNGEGRDNIRKRRMSWEREICEDDNRARGRFSYCASGDGRVTSVEGEMGI
jgi:hypothetical protein